MMRNYTHLIVASNSDWVVPASADERRFFVLDVPSVRKGDHEYFRRVHEAWQSGEREAFLFHLQTLDISDFNVRKVPQTEALLSQKLMSLGVIDRWYFDALQRGHFELETWQEWLPTRNLHESLVSWCKLVHAKVPTVEAMGMRLAALVPPSPGRKNARVQRMQDRARLWGYELGSIESCRKQFEIIMGSKVEWVTEQGVESAPALNSDRF
jgi:hypothetical protein